MIFRNQTKQSHTFLHKLNYKNQISIIVVFINNNIQFNKHWPEITTNPIIFALKHALNCTHFIVLFERIKYNHIFCLFFTYLLIIWLNFITILIYLIK